MSTYESDAVTAAIRRELAESQHLVRHAAADMVEANKLLVELTRSLRSIFRQHNVSLEASLAATHLAVEAASVMLRTKTALAIGDCGCKTLVDRAAIDTPPLPPPTPEQIERQVVEPTPIRQPPRGGFRLSLVKAPPRGPNGAA